MYTAGDVYAAQRELGSERSAEWPVYIEWRRGHREGDIVADFEAWLDSVPASDLPGLIEQVNDALEADETGKASSPSPVAAV